MREARLLPLLKGASLLLFRLCKGSKLKEVCFLKGCRDCKELKEEKALISFLSVFVSLLCVYFAFLFLKYFPVLEVFAWMEIKTNDILLLRSNKNSLSEYNMCHLNKKLYWEVELVFPGNEKR